LTRRLAWAALAVGLPGCDRNLGPPDPVTDVYCTDICPSDYFGLPDFHECLDWCENEPSLTQEHLNCFSPVARSNWEARIPTCEAVLGEIDRP
jgi:hypothetical protein